MRVRFADMDDAEAIFGLLVAMHTENGLAPLAPVKADAMMRHVLRTGAVILIEKDGGPIATCGLVEESHWYSETRYLTDRWTFVLREHRGSRAAWKLIEAARKVAKEAGLPLALGITTPAQIVDKMRFYQRQGFALVGALFISQEG